MNCIIVGLLVGFIAPIILVQLAKILRNKSAVTNFLTIELECSACGHKGAFVKESRE